MATPTYTLIEEQVLGSAQASVTFGSGGTLTQAYKDLVLEIVHTNTAGNSDIGLRVGNGSVDTGSNYSRIRLFGNGTTAGSSLSSSAVYSFLGYTRTTIGTTFIQLMSYANTNTNKTFVSRSGTASDDTNAFVGLWRLTAAINVIEASVNSNNFASGSTFRLWGIAG